MEQKAVDKWWKKKKAVWIGAGVLGLAAVSIAVFLLFFAKSSTNGQTDSRPERGTMGEAMVSATGLTKTGTIDESYEFTFLESSLTVEEAYLSIGDVVEEHTAAFSISEESLEEAAQELQNAEMEAELAYRQGVTDYEEGKLEAEKALALAAVEVEYAQAVYDSSLQTAAESVETLEAQVKEQSELVEEYAKAADGNYYYEYYEVEEKKERYYEYFTYLMEIYETWDVEYLYDQYPNGGSSTMTAVQTSTSEQTDMAAGGGAGGEGGGGGAGQPSGGGSSSNEESSKLTVYEMLQTLVDNYAASYEEAVENYESKSSLAAASLTQAQIELEALQADLTDAGLEYEKNKITCQKEYDTTLAEGESAKLVYETKQKELEEAFAALEEDWTDAKENRELFETAFEDGIFYTRSAGTILSNQVKAGADLSDVPILFSYRNPESVTVAASVSQDDIAEIGVGDSAYVSVSGYGDFDGTVKSMEPIAASGSRSSVTYTVNVELSGAVDALESNLTASVIFGTTKEEQAK